jgi:hypothetical protein
MGNAPIAVAAAIAEIRTLVELRIEFPGNFLWTLPSHVQLNLGSCIARLVQVHAASAKKTKKKKTHKHPFFRRL